jgi:hypothetical protein
MNNATRRALIERKKQSGFPGSIIDVFRAYDQGVDLIGQFQQQQQMQVANTPQQQQEGLRPQHQAGNTNASMAFPNTPPDASFNTVGMKAPINLKQYDPRGNLVKSYEAVPPGVTDLKMSSQGGTVIETPAQMKNGGVRKYQLAGPLAGPRVPEMSDAEMSLKIIQEANAGNPAARRMRSDYGQRMFLPGETDPSTHYMASFDNYAVPTVQEDYIGGPLSYNPNPAPSKADFRFDTPEQANYFAKNYKQASAAKTFQQKNGGVRKYQSGDFLYGDWREVGREVDPLTNDTVITEQRDGSRTLEYNKRGVNWDVGYRRWLAQGNTGTLAEFKARADAWKRSQAKTEYDTQTRTNRISNTEEDKIFADLFPIPTLGPSPISTSPYENYPSDVSSEVLNSTGNSQGAYGYSNSSGTFGGLGSGFTSTSNQPNVGTVLNETPVEYGFNSTGESSSPFNVQSTYNLDSRQNRAGKTRSVYTDDINVTRADGTATNTRTRQVNVTRPEQETKTRGRSIFEEFDADGNRIVRQVDRLQKGGMRKYFRHA